MAAARIWVAALLATFLFGCVPSLQPFYKGSDVRNMTGLAGQWRDSDSVIWDLRSTGTGTYQCTRADGDRQGAFVVHAFSLNGADYLDIFPVRDSALDEAYGITLVLAHVVAKVRVTDDSLSVGLLSGSWLMDRLQDGSVNVAYQENGDAGVLTATTDDLRQFLVAHGNDSGAFISETLARANVQR